MCHKCFSTDLCCAPVRPQFKLIKKRSLFAFKNLVQTKIKCSRCAGMTLSHYATKIKQHLESKESRSDRFPPSFTTRITSASQDFRCSVARVHFVNRCVLNYGLLFVVLVLHRHNLVRRWGEEFALPALCFYRLNCALRESVGLISNNHDRAWTGTKISIQELVVARLAQLPKLWKRAVSLLNRA